MDFTTDITSVEKKLFDRATENKTPIYGILELLPLCNMNCDMCYVRLSRQEMEQQGRLRTAEEWLELARRMQQSGVLFLLLTGGEPLLYPDFRKLYLELKVMGMFLTINTNGTLIDEEWAEFFGKHLPRRINITLYGSGEQAYRELCHYPGGFEKTIDGIRLLREHGVDVKMNCSLTKANRDGLEQITAIAKELGVPIHMDTYMFPATRERNRPYDEQIRLNPQDAAVAKVQFLKASETPEAFQTYAIKNLYFATHTPPGEERPGTVGCRAGRCSFTVNWQGQIRPCVMLESPGIPVFETGFESAWKEIVAGVEKIRLSAKCNSCTLRSVCNPCAACALFEGGSYDAVPEYMCSYTKETLRCLLAELQKKQSCPS